MAAVARLPYDDAEAWQDPAFLEAQRATASTVTVVEGEKQVVNLRLATR